MAQPAQVSATPSPSVAAPPVEAVSRKLKAAIVESAARLGEIEPWQQRILDEEAVPQYQRFIRNYRSAQTHSGTAVNNLVVDIDIDSLKNYLKFYAPKTLGRELKAAPVLMYLRGEAECLKCTAAGPGLRALASARVERRGLTAVWLSADDLGVAGADLKGKALEDKVAELAAARNAAGALVLQWGPAPVDEDDVAHADEKHYLLRSMIQARGLAGTGKLPAAEQSLARVEGAANLLETDSFEAMAAKLFSDAFVELGAKAQQAEIARAGKLAGAAGEREIELDISGIRDFAQYTRLKTQVAGRFPAASLEERKIARGRAVLTLVGEKSEFDAIRTSLIGLKIDEGQGRLAAASVEMPQSVPQPQAEPGATDGGAEPASAPPPRQTTLYLEIRP